MVMIPNTCKILDCTTMRQAKDEGLRRGTMACTKSQIVSCTTTLYEPLLLAEGKVMFWLEIKVCGWCISHTQ